MTQTQGPQTCPLCRTGELPPFADVRGRPFYQCGTCRLIFLHPRLRPTPAAERAQYETHENNPADSRYRQFLDRLAEPLLARLPPAAEGLDYGAGPGPTLSIMLEERGHPMTDYDPHFMPNDTALERTWDFITCSETAEHFFDPGREFARLDRLLRPAGWLGLMTLRPGPDTNLGDWHYLRDPTHVCFYQDPTLDWMAGHFGWRLETVSNSVALFQKPGVPVRAGREPLR